MAPKSRTDTTSRTSFTLKRPNNNIASFILYPKTNTTRIALPPGSVWTPSPHWHESYTEYVRCISGRLLVRLNGEDRIVTPDDGPQTVEKGVVHEFMRADVHGHRIENDAGENEDVIVEEWTDPADGMKHVFFRTVFSILEDYEKGYWGWRLAPQVLLSLGRLDNWNVLVGSGKGGVGWFGWGLTHAAYFVGGGAARLLRLRAWYREYVPEELWAVADRKAG